MDVLLASPRGFCAGVERAIEIVERALELHGAPIYVRHEIVHNKYVVDDLRAKGAVFVEELDEVPAGGTVIFSAHGVSQQVRADAERRGLKVFDATCPLVTKVHVEVSKMLHAGFEIVMIGHRGHPEAEGTMGQAIDGMHLVETVDDVAGLRVASPERVAYVTQTTLSVDDARAIVAAHVEPHAVRGEDDRGTPRHFVQLLDEHRALGAQVLDHELVVHDLVAHVDRGAVLLERALDDGDGAVHAGAVAARRRQQELLGGGEH